MRRLVFIFGAVFSFGIACTPGSGEYGACLTTPDCQVQLQCVGPADGGICRRTCTVPSDCTSAGEICGASYCSKDGGY